MSNYHNAEARAHALVKAGVPTVDALQKLDGSFPAHGLRLAMVQDSEQVFRVMLSMRLNEIDEQTLFDLIGGLKSLAPNEYGRTIAVARLLRVILGDEGGTNG